MKILNFGSLNIDYVYRVAHILQPGETLKAGEMEVFPGGKGLNQSIAAARAGAEVYHAGMVGAEDGGFLLDVCRENQVNTDYIRRAEGKSGHTIIQVDDNAQNSILLYGGGNRKITEDFIGEVLAGFGKGDILVLQNEINLLDIIEQEQTEVTEQMEFCENAKKVKRLLTEVLSDREREIIYLRYGLLTGRDVTQREIGEALHISRSYVSRIEKKALLKLREKFEE